MLDRCRLSRQRHDGPTFENPDQALAVVPRETVVAGVWIRRRLVQTNQFLGSPPQGLGYGAPGINELSSDRRQPAARQPVEHILDTFYQT